MTPTLFLLSLQAWALPISSFSTSYTGATEGWSPSAMADQNADGIDEIVNGAGAITVGAHWGGVIEIFHGSTARNNAPYARIVGVLPEGRIGDMMTVGDVDCDGIDDIITRSAEATATLRVFLGPVTPGDRRSDSADLLITSQPGEILTPTAVRDVTGDGCDDLLVSGGFILEGTLSTSVDLRAAAWAQLTELVGSSGWSGDVGDVDGDGVTDLALAYGTRSRRIVPMGLLRPGVQLASAVSWQIDDPRLREVTTAGDLDGDGLADLALSDVVIVRNTMKSAVTIIPGATVAASPPGTSFDAARVGSSWYDPRQQGTTEGALGVGDMNADGFDDLVLMSRITAPVQGATPTLSYGFWFLPGRGVLPPARTRTPVAGVWVDATGVSNAVSLAEAGVECDGTPGTDLLARVQVVGSPTGAAVCW